MPDTNQSDQQHVDTLTTKLAKEIAPILQEHGYCYEHNNCGEKDCLGTRANTDAVTAIAAYVRDKIDSEYWRTIKLTEQWKISEAGQGEKV